MAPLQQSTQAMSAPNAPQGPPAGTRKRQLCISTATRHIDIRYLWITDRLKQEKISVEYCPTKYMLGDFFVKPLGGSLFVTMRDICQGLIPLSKLKTRHKLKMNEKSKSELLNSDLLVSRDVLEN